MATPTTLPATFVAGNVLTAAQMNDLRGGFRIVQFLQSASSTNQGFGGSWADLTNASLTLTPQSTSNKILCLFTSSGVMSGGGTVVDVRFVRGATALFEESRASVPDGFRYAFGYSFVDSPNTTSSTTYKVQYQRAAGTWTNEQFQFVVMEISL